ncbi:protein FAR1-RELATED SEQUENCE 5-like [Myzus persicae]|uniref:protein FAR1-RELATED SEQUENCE 5-like n=1 Tax=Myzus persicae TaxID=13164 RepID=UPI000B9330F2|nr:protein FAR1-RELATED SEQUENCE 5-like [Myzus persicae]
MKNNFDSYPEIVLLDGTYKLLNFGGVVYLFIIEDSIGSSEIIAVGILLGEIKEYIDWLILTFKNKNNCSSLIKTFMTDKDENMRNVLRQHFPTSKLILCKFHVFQIFKREITTNKLGITPCEESTTKEYFQNISYSKSIEEYENTYESMTQLLPTQVMKYFNNNWNPIKDEWVDAFINDNFLNFTNNRTESLNRNLKSVIRKLSSLEEFLTNFFIELHIERTERDHKAIKSIHKIPVISNDILPIKKYSDLLTQYSFSHVEKEYLASLKMNNNSLENIGVTITLCDCKFFRSMKLPCRHIIKKRQLNNLDIFDQQLCLPRWTKNYLLQNQNAFQPQINSPDSGQDSISYITFKKKQSPKSAFEKYKEASNFTTKLCQLASEVGHSIYNNRIEVLKNIIKHWGKHQEIIVIPIEESLNKVNCN